MLPFILFFSAFLGANAFEAVYYWGQASAGSQERLSYYCESGDVDTVILSFMSAFPGTNNVPTLNFASACSDTYSDGLLHCTQIASDIQTCQDKGIKVLLSMGGASGAYGFSSDSVAESFADTLWNMFLEGSDSSVNRPFDDAVIDGFDLDIEDNDSTGYVALVQQLRKNFAKGSKTYYISAAPQCPNPDASLNEVLTNADIDFAFIQFYNNYCDADTTSFNWDTWTTWAKDSSYNKDIKLYLGLPGSSTAASRGYMAASSVKSIIDSISCSSYFSGVSIWDASQAFLNTDGSSTFAAEIKSYLDSASCASTTTSSTKASTTTSTKASTSSSTKASTTTSTSSTKASTTTSTKASTSSSTKASTTTTSAATSAASSTTATTPKTSQASSTKTSASATHSSTLTSTVCHSCTTTVYGTSSTTLTTKVSSTKTSSTSKSSIASRHAPTSTASRTTSTLAPTVSKTSTTSTTSTTSATSSPTATSCSSLTGTAKAKCLNTLFAADTLHVTPCNNGDFVCRPSGSLAQCANGVWYDLGCAAGTTCYAYSQDDEVFVGCNFVSGKSAFV